MLRYSTNLLKHMLCVIIFYLLICYLAVTSHTGVSWPLLGVWQIQSCCLAVERMLKFCAPTLTQARYCIQTIFTVWEREGDGDGSLFAVLGITLLWVVSPCLFVVDTCASRACFGAARPLPVIVNLTRGSLLLFCTYLVVQKIYLSQ